MTDERPEDKSHKRLCLEGVALCSRRNVMEVLRDVEEGKTDLQREFTENKCVHKYVMYEKKLQNHFTWYHLEAVGIALMEALSDSKQSSQYRKAYKLFLKHFFKRQGGKERDIKRLAEYIGYNGDDI